MVADGLRLLLPHTGHACVFLGGGLALQTRYSAVMPFAAFAVLSSDVMANLLSRAGLEAAGADSA